jgi:hypothetical protein
LVEKLKSLRQIHDLALAAKGKDSEDANKMYNLSLITSNYSRQQMIRADTKYKKVASRLKTELMGRYVLYTPSDTGMPSGFVVGIRYVITDFKSNSN